MGHGVSALRAECTLITVTVERMGAITEKFDRVRIKKIVGVISNGIWRL